MTGNELADPGSKIEPWQIRDSNRVMLSAAVADSGGEVTCSERCGDSIEDIGRAIREAEGASQIILVSGGVSVGPHDLVREAAEREGFEQLFWKVRQKPGKPLYLAKKSDLLLFGLPGNPVSALNCYVYYVHPLLRTMQGRQFNWRTVSGRLNAPVHNRGERNLFLRVEVSQSERGRRAITPLEKQGPHMISSLASADGFVLLHPGERAGEGEEVRVFLYPWEK
jgi:molybdopterin molybdotransferase